MNLHPLLWLRARKPETMSAYGTITVTGWQIDSLPQTSWELPEPGLGKPAAPFRRLVLHHLRCDSAGAHPGPLEYTHQVFAAEVEAGRTYPQGAVATRGASGDTDLDAPCMTTSESRFYTRAAFEAYFWAADVGV
jgi:hypothetical protein